MSNAIAVKGVVSGALSFNEQFSTTFALGQIGRKFGPRGAAAAGLAEQCTSAEAFFSESVAWNSAAPQEHAKGVFLELISDQQGPRGGRKLRAWLGWRNSQGN